MRLEHSSKTLMEGLDMCLYHANACPEFPGRVILTCDLRLTVDHIDPVRLP